MNRSANAFVCVDIVLAICVISTACATLPGNTPTQNSTPSAMKSYQAADLFGIWHLDKEDTLISFHDDGSYARDAGGQLLTEPGSFGNYSVNGFRLTFHVTSDPCPTPGQYVWEIEIPEDGHLAFAVVEDTTCYSATGIKSAWTRLSPDSRMELSPPSSVTPEQGIPASVSNLRGIWYVAGSSTLISFARYGTYAYDDKGTLDTSPMDSGTYEAVGPTLTLTSGSDSVICSAGDILLLEDVKFLYPGWWVI
jgi:hypothetical protein